MRLLRYISGIVTAVLIGTSPAAVYAKVNDLSITQIRQDGTDVRIYASVRDEEDKSILQMPGEDDFSVLCEGKQYSPEECTTWGRTDEKLSYVIGLDTSYSVSPDIYNKTKHSVTDFISRLKDTEQVQLITVTESAQPLTELTGDREQLFQAVEKTENGAGAHQLSAGVRFALESCARALQNGSQRAAVILFTSGERNETQLSDEFEIIGLCNQIRVPVYIITLSGDAEADYTFADRIAKQSGGLVLNGFEDGVENTFPQVEELIRNVCRISVKPEENLYGKQDLNWCLVYDGPDGRVESGTYTFSLSSDGVVFPDQEESQPEEDNAKDQSNPEEESEQNAQVKSRTKTELKAQVKSETKTEPKADEKQIAQTEPKADEKQIAQTEPKAEEKTRAKAETEADEKQKAQTESKAEEKTRAKAEADEKQKAQTESKAAEKTKEKTKSESETELKSKPEEETQKKTETKQKAETGPAAEIRSEAESETTGLQETGRTAGTEAEEAKKTAPSDTAGSRDSEKENNTRKKAESETAERVYVTATGSGVTDHPGSEAVSKETTEESSTGKDISGVDKMKEFITENFFIVIAALMVLVAVLIIIILLLKSRSGKKKQMQHSAYQDPSFSSMPLYQGQKPSAPPASRPPYSPMEKTMDEYQDQDAEKTVDEYAGSYQDDERTIDSKASYGIRLFFAVSFDGRTQVVEKILREELILGRGDHCDVDVVFGMKTDTAKQTSREHAVIVNRSEGLFVRDNNSRNGTLLNGREIHEETPIRNNDILQLGKTVVRIEIDRASI